MNRRPLTRVQVDLLRCIADSVHLNGYPPSVRELQSASGLASLSTVVDELNRLEARGYIARNERVARGIRLIETPDEPERHNATTLTPPTD